MRDFQILRYIKKWKYLIIIGMFLGLTALFLYLSRQQYYYATMNIEYLNNRAAEGFTPNGLELNPEEIRTATIVNSALDVVGYDFKVDDIRNSLSIKGIVTEEEENLKKAVLEKGEEYTMIPTNYEVRLSVNSKYSEDIVQNVLTAIVNEYMTWYGNMYVITRAKPGVLDAELLEKHDYIIAMSMISKSIDSMLEYIYICGETFRSTQSGLSFYDLQTQLQMLRDSQYEDVYVKIINSGTTKDPNLVRDYYTADIESMNLQHEKLLLEAEEIESLLEIYEQRMLEAQAYSTAGGEDGGDGGSNSIILDHVYEIYDENDQPVYSQNNYETLLDIYAGYYSSSYALERSITEDEYILASFANVTRASSKTSQEYIHGEIMALIDNINRIYEQLNLLGTEYNQSRVAENIKVTSSARAFQGVNIKLYMALGSILFLGVGCAGAIVIGRAGDLMEYVLYTDKVTGLPSRTSCDEEIEKIGKEGALDTFTVVCLFVTNLAEINGRYGREKGNQMLAELGLILQVTAKQYNCFIGYNNGNQFLCLLRNSAYDKGKDMLDFVSYELGKSQAELKPSITAKIGESHRLSAYQINNLISHTFRQQEIVVFKPLNNGNDNGGST